MDLTFVVNVKLKLEMDKVYALMRNKMSVQQQNNEIKKLNDEL